MQFFLVIAAALLVSEEAVHIFYKTKIFNNYRALASQLPLIPKKNPKIILEVGGLILYRM